MPSAWDTFNNAYIKSYMNTPYNPDDAYGAGMLPGSQNVNPSASRDYSNSIIGSLFGRPGTNAMTSGGAGMDLLSMLQGGKTAKPLSALSSSGSPLTIPAGSSFSEMAPTLSNVPTTDLGTVGGGMAGMGMSMAPMLLRRMFGGATGNVAEGAVDATKTGIDVAGAVSGDPLSMVQLPFDALKDFGFIRKLFR